MAQKILILQHDLPQLKINKCCMGMSNLICSCGYKEKLIYKDRDYCPECANPTIDIDIHVIAGELVQEKFTRFKQSFYKLIIAFDHEINDDNLFIESEYKLSFDFDTYILQMEQYKDNQLVSIKEKLLLNTQENYYQNIIKMFDSKTLYFDEDITNNDKFQDNYFMVRLDPDFPGFVHNWLYFIFGKNLS
ncbi:hypothetical protein SJPD1_1017 [Sulfurospirillum diekertiae]|uniref:Uncharacterized protein n=1 Tax=Sulfurospirillum diekertiae TaxID=1854492 RepID=A0A290HUT4_9BACT|nr:hypothetical protein [Sulfurospirillum diekertiae]ATB69129.1 hypothetical protein SJPD1_1017 [Sulfurospirillum diekertiae]